MSHEGRLLERGRRKGKVVNVGCPMCQEYQQLKKIYKEDKEEKLRVQIGVQFVVKMLLNEVDSGKSYGKEHYSVWYCPMCGREL